MNDLTDILRPDAIVTDLSAKSKKALFFLLANVSGAADAKDVADRLMAREKLGTTGFGGGVAIPHARVEGGSIVGVFARLSEPMEFGAVDGLPVDLVFAMFSPVNAGAEHLKALARVSRRLRDRAFLAKLRGAGSRDALYALFAADVARDAA